ncbi:MAG: hypothetical protein KGJ90_04745 [Patescibacteria group bacterium]|nr:hypothetical protein [Patescibacteria group bacterium]
MTLDEPMGNARTLLQTDSNGLINADAISLSNEAQYAVIADLIKRGINAAQIQESYENATTDVGTYLWPSDLWLPKEVMVNYIDTNDYNYVECDIIDSGNLPTGENIQTIRYNQSKVNPVIENRGDWFEIFPAPSTTKSTDNLTQFFWLFYFLAPVKFVSSVGDGTDVTVPYPLNLDAWLLAYRMAQIQSMRGDDEAQARAAQYEKQYLMRLDTIENIIKKPTQKSITPTGLPLTGYEF